MKYHTKTFWFSTRKLVFQKILVNILNINVNSIVISKLIWAKSNSQFLIGYLDKVIRPLVSVLSKINTLKHAYVKIFKVFFKNVFSFYHKQIHPVTNYKAIKNKINKRRQHRTIFF